MQNKNETLAKLYSIKAGLSAISIEKDKLAKAELSLIDDNKKIKDAKAEIVDIDKQVVILNNKLSSIKNENIPKSSKNFIGEYVGVGAGIGGGVGFLAGFIVSFIFDVVLGSTVSKYLVYFLTLLAFLVIGAGIGVFAGVIKQKSADKKSQAEYYKKIKGQNGDIKYYEGQISYFVSEKSKYQDKIVKINDEYVEHRLSYNQEKLVVIPTAKILYDALVEEYSSTLDPRDWQNIDLIIYYYETGRADTLKEALQQVDEQRRHERLIREIKNATLEISKTIERCANELIIAIDRNFSALSTQLTNQHNEIVGKIEKINTSLTVINSNISSLVQTAKESNEFSKKVLKNIESISTNSYLNNALLQKITTNSTDLVDDTNYLLFYKEPKEIKKA